MSFSRRWLLAALLIASASCTNPPTDVNTAQQLVDIADAMNALRNDNALLQEQMDSLRTAVARQDTIITRLASASGVSLPPR